MSFLRASVSPVSICVMVVVVLFVVFANLAMKTTAVNAGGRVSDRGGANGEQLTVFSNPAPIAPADRASNSAGTNPGIPPSNYPSPIAVAGLTGTVTKVTVTFAITSTFPDDFDILLVGPTGAMSLVMSDAGGSGDPTNVTYTFDQSAPTTMPDNPTTVVPAGTFQPTNFVGFATPEPGGQDNFPMAGGLMSYPTGFNVFNGTNPNGTWNLYVVDDQQFDTMSLPSGWSIDITTGGGGGGTDAAVDFNGDSRSDYVVVRNTGGGATGQVTWFINNSSGGATQAFAWGLATDFFIAEDFDGDGRDDIATWRPGPPTVALFYILNSNGFTLRGEVFGQTGDDPTVVGDYNNDGMADVAVYRAGVTTGQQSVWYFRTTPGGPVNFAPWGQTGDVPAPGDYDGDGRNDFVVQRGTGGQAHFWRNLTTAADDIIGFGVASDLVVPGDYDGDGKTDIAVARGSASIITWHWFASGTGAYVTVGFGASATDVPVQGDYDGDGKTDRAVWRNGVFWVQNTVSGAVHTFTLGSTGDYPVANFNVH